MNRRVWHPRNRTAAWEPQFTNSECIPRADFLGKSGNPRCGLLLELPRWRVHSNHSPDNDDPMLCRSCAEPPVQSEGALPADRPAVARPPLPVHCSGCGSPVSELRLEDLFSAKMRLLRMFGLSPEVEVSTPAAAADAQNQNDVPVV